jgi:hypothetical protein
MTKTQKLTLLFVVFYVAGIAFMVIEKRQDCRVANGRYVSGAGCMKEELFAK